jgi:hypothetical protein
MTPSRVRAARLAARVRAESPPPSLRYARAVASDTERERDPLLKRPMGYGTVGSFVAYLLALLLGVATLVILGRYGVFDPQFS